MKAISIEDRNPILVEQLVKVWKGSVKETHTFLSDEEINHIQEYVPQALREVPHLMIIEDDHGFPCAFMGINEHKLEMLFVSPEARGRGLGKKLIETGIREYSVNWELTNKILRRKRFTNIWDFMSTEERRPMNRASLTPFYT